MVKRVLKSCKVACVSGLLSVRKIYVSLSPMAEVYLTYSLIPAGSWKLELELTYF